MNFVNLLLKENRISYIQEIAQEYGNVNSKALKMTIIVATEIDEKQVETIVEKYKTLYKADKAEYNVKIDPSIIGGIKVIVGNKVYDNSIDTQLKQMI